MSKWWKPSREPDFVVGGKSNPYMKRWYVIPRNRLFNIYLHQIMRSDDDRALHDHPWINLSIILEGGYVEHTIADGGIHYQHPLKKGQWRWRWPTKAHRLEISTPCWSLFITGPVVRAWGFHCPQGWRHFKDFVADSDRGLIGRGCE